MGVSRESGIAALVASATIASAPARQAQPIALRGQPSVPREPRRRPLSVNISDDPSVRELCHAIVTGAMDGPEPASHSLLCADIRRRRKCRAAERRARLAAAQSSAERHSIRRQTEAEERAVRDKEALQMAGIRVVAEEPEERAESDVDVDPFAQQVQLVDGKIVLSQHSAVAVATRTPRKRRLVVEESARYYNQGTFLRNENRVSSRWREDEIELFYEGLASFGMNFEAIARMIPGKTRFNVKSRFKREQTNAPHKIDAALQCKKPMPLHEYSAATGIDVAAFARPPLPLEDAP